MNPDGYTITLEPEITKDGKFYSANVNAVLDVSAGQIGCSEFHTNTMWCEGFEWTATLCTMQDADGNDHELTEEQFRAAVGDEVDALIDEEIDNGRW